MRSPVHPCVRSAQRLQSSTKLVTSCVNFGRVFSGPHIPHHRTPCLRLFLPEFGLVTMHSQDVTDSGNPGRSTGQGELNLLVLTGMLRCFQPATAACFVRRRLASSVMSAAISPSLNANNRLDTYFRKNSPIWMGRTSLGSGRRCGRYRLPALGVILVVVKLFCSWLSFFPNKDLRVEQKARNIEHPEHPPPLARAGERLCYTEVLLPLTSWPRGSHGCHLNVGQRGESRVASPFLSHGPSCFSASTATKR